MTFLLSFLFGGLLCALAQILIDRTSLCAARILVIYVTAGVLIGALGWYEPLRDLFGCGITVPLVGFGGNIAAGVREAVDAYGILGAFTGPFTAASAGVCAALIFSFLFLLVFSSGPKRITSRRP